jgi:SpoVK/Ycf46/Vps4 family AAA+-type ATPase
MPPHSSVIAALAAAVQAAPDDLPLRLHLGSLLFQAGDPTAALEQFTFVLARDPAHVEALKGAAEAAVGAGDTTRAEGYRRLHQALSSSLADPAPPRPPAPPARRTEGPGGPGPGIDWNQLLRQPPAGEDVPPGVPDERGTEERLRAETREEPRGEWEAERPEMTLADVAGMEDVKRRLNVGFLAPMRNPEFMKMYGKSLRGGLMLYGPPGCGKTFIARALAGELGAKFISVGLADVLDMWLGESEKRLQDIFDTARRNAPCVLFFDEIDALGQKRSNLKYSAGRNVVNQLLSELDSVGANNQGVFVLSATNHPWDVDTALRRPGRFDRTMLVLPPDETAREAVIRAHLKDRPAEGVDVRWIASKTAEFSGADLAYLCENAAESAMEAAMAAGKARPISTDDFKKAMRDVRPSTRPWFEIARNYAMFSNEGGVYDELLAYIRAHKI